MVLGDEMIFRAVIGKIPSELLGDDLVATSEHEWTSRILKWALQPVTGTPAAEHMITPGTVAGQRCLVVYKRSNLSTPVCAVEAAGCNAGRVSSLSALH
jgi:hypothetical protein